MIAKKILIVSRSFYPSNSPRAFRTTELAKEFARQGHQVKVITPLDSRIHTDYGKEHNIEFKDMGTPSWKPFSISGSKIQSLIGRIMMRVFKLAMEYPDIQLIRMVKKALKQETDYDLLVSVAVPHPVHWGVAAARNKRNKIAKIWIADCGDPYMGSENDSFKPLFYFKYVEKWFCRKADFIAVPTQGAINGYYPEFHQKIKIIPQGFNFEEIMIKEPGIKHDYPIFGYGGIFIPGRRDPTELLNYLIGLKMNFQFHIFTKTPDIVIPFVAKSEGRIVLHDPIPRSELLYELSGMDFMINFENVGNIQTPSKLIDYAIINKPVLSIKTGAFDTNMVEAFLNGNYAGRLDIDSESYRIKNVASKFLELIYGN